MQALVTRGRCLLVSLATTSLEVVLFAICVVTVGGRALLIARWACGALGALANYLLNRRWSFAAAADGAWRGQLARFALTAVIAVSLATTCWWSLGRITGWDPRLLHLLSMGLVWLLVTYPLLSRWVFVARTPS